MGEEKLINIVALLFVGAICLLMFINLGTLIFVQKIELLSVESPLVFAFLIAVVLLICIGITTIRDFVMKNKKIEESRMEDEKNKYLEIKKVIIYVIGILVYVQFLKILHFSIGTITFMTISMFFLNNLHDKKRFKLLKALGASVVTVPVLYLVFSVIFNVILP